MGNDARRCRGSNGRRNPLKKQSHIFGRVCRLVDDDECFPRSSLITDMSRLMPLQLMGNPGFSLRAAHPPPRLRTDVAALNALRSVGTHVRAEVCAPADKLCDSKSRVPRQEAASSLGLFWRSNVVFFFWFRSIGSKFENGSAGALHLHKFHITHEMSSH